MNEREIFLTALQIKDSEARCSFLESICESDERLRHRIENLMNAHQSPQKALERITDFIASEAVETGVDVMAGGKRRAAKELFALVYDELRRVAAAQLAGERIGQTLQPTALVHEVFLRLVVPDTQPNWTSVGHFMAVAAEVMRHILIDNARRKKRIKYGGEFQRLNVELDSVSGQIDNEQLIELDNALNELELLDPIKAKLIVLRYFGGMTIEQCCDVLGISRTTAHRHWTYARAWLFQRVGRLDEKDLESGPPATGA